LAQSRLVARPQPQLGTAIIIATTIIATMVIIITTTTIATTLIILAITITVTGIATKSKNLSGRLNRRPSFFRLVILPLISAPTHPQNSWPVSAGDKIL
jgi:hypothetical protein